MNLCSIEPTHHGLWPPCPVDALRYGSVALVETTARWRQLRAGDNIVLSRGKQPVSRIIRICTISYTQSISCNLLTINLSGHKAFAPSWSTPQLTNPRRNHLVLSPHHLTPVIDRGIRFLTPVYAHQRPTA